MSENLAFNARSFTFNAKSNGFDSGKDRQGYFAERQMATVRL